jgi:hypothetical protein
MFTSNQLYDSTYPFHSPNESLCESNIEIKGSDMQEFLCDESMSNEILPQLEKQTLRSPGIEIRSDDINSCDMVSV